MPDPKLRFITGKGGVGKTTVAAAFSVLATASATRVLAVDTVNRGELAPRIDELLPEAEINPELGPGLSTPTVLGLTTTDSLDEYIKQYLRIPIAPSSLGPLSRIFEFVSTAAPGVKEILTVGKIGHEVVNRGWERVMVDAPASGHVVELLAAPASLARLAPTGPLASQTRWLQDLLHSPQTAVTVVATPEELPVAETAQLLARLNNETEVAVDSLIINRVPPSVDAVEPITVASSVKTDSVRAALQMLAGVAVDRHQTAQPHVERLHQLADEYGLTAIEIVDNPTAPTATVAVAVQPSFFRS